VEGMNPENYLTVQPIPKLIRKLAVPACIGYFFHTMYNVVDTFFGGLISTEALASLSLSLPVYFIILAMGTGISTGATALIGNALGEGDREKAQLFSIQGVTFGVFIAVLITIAGIWISPPLFIFLGASGEYLEMVSIYMNTIFLGSFFFMLVYMFNAILTSQGDTRSFRNFLIGGFILNILLDPWFIYGGLGIPPMEIMGIALATVLIQVIGAVYLGMRVYGTGVLDGKTMGAFLPRWGMVKEIARQGFPATVSILSVGIGMYVITYFISQFGKEAVAAYGTAMRVEQIALAPTIGLNVATLTLVAQNNGARLFQRIRETINKVLFYGAVLMVLGGAGVIIFAPYLMGIFTEDSGVIGIGTTYLRIDALVFYAYVVLFANVAVLQGVKRPMYAIWIGLSRQIVAPIIVFYVLVFVLEVRLTSIWWGIFAITWCAAVITILYTRSVLGKIMEGPQSES